MNDDELRSRFDKLEEKIEEVRSEASSKGHFWILIMLIFLLFRGC